MSSIEHPLLADTVYGGVLAAGMQRQALHAVRLMFVHPVTNMPMVFESTPPSDFLAAAHFWGLTYNSATF
jgi:23S rRNA pseudouridine1911/1915/1917 synthase